jgi:hypothetical protein
MEEKGREGERERDREREKERERTYSPDKAWSHNNDISPTLKVSPLNFYHNGN